MNKRTMITALIALMGIIMNPHISFAEEIDPLLAINEDGSLTDAEKFEKAKAGLEMALSLALDKVAQLTTDLETRQFDEASREAEMRSLFIQDLSAYRTYYSETLTKAQTLENLGAVQALAQEVKNYRDATYTPGIEGIVEFVSVFYTEEVLRTARERFEKVSADIEKLETLGLIEIGTFNEQVVAIETLLKEAEDLRIQASDIILTVEDAATSTDLVVEAVETVTTTQAEVVETPIVETGTSTILLPDEVTPRTLLQTSLGNVKGAYEIFLEISTSVRERLGLD